MVTEPVRAADVVIADVGGTNAFVLRQTEKSQAGQSTQFVRRRTHPQSIIAARTTTRYIMARVCGRHARRIRISTANASMGTRLSA
tara:strand:- start:972 stop:1229 length:258 start_codon:yes stop_codon:yes gene_type:complete